MVVGAKNLQFDNHPDDLQPRASFEFNFHSKKWATHVFFIQKHDKKVTLQPQRGYPPSTESWYVIAAVQLRDDGAVDARPAQLHPEFLGHARRAQF